MSGGTSSRERHVPTVAEVEESGEWVSAPHSGYASTVYDWQRRGLLAGRDVKVMRVRLTLRRGSPKREVTVVKKVAFFRRRAVDRLAAKRPEAQGLAGKAAWSGRTAQKKIHGVVHLRSGAAAAFLGITVKSLQTVPDLDPVHETVNGPKVIYYPLPRLKDVREEDRRIRRPGCGQVSLKEARRLSGLKGKCLCDPEWCRKNGIVQERRERPFSTAGEVRVLYFFEQASLLAYAHHPGVTLPETHVTTAQAAKMFHTSSGDSVAEVTVRGWCRKGILRAVWGEVPVGRRRVHLRGRKGGWHIPRAVVTAAAAVILEEPNPQRWAAALRNLSGPLPPATPASPKPNEGAEGTVEEQDDNTRRGRPSGQHAGTHQAVVAAFREGPHAGNRAAVGRAFGLDRSTVSKILKAAGVK
jgi:hypothetical protein